MTGKDIVKLAVDLSAGSITAAYIKEKYGDHIFSTVAALVAGGISGILADKAIDTIDDYTGVVSVAGDVVDTGIDMVKDVFKGWF